MTISARSLLNLWTNVSKNSRSRFRRCPRASEAAHANCLSIGRCRTRASNGVSWCRDGSAISMCRLRRLTSSCNGDLIKLSISLATMSATNAPPRSAATPYIGADIRTRASFHSINPSSAARIKTSEPEKLKWENDGESALVQSPAAKRETSVVSSSYSTTLRAVALRASFGAFISAGSLARKRLEIGTRWYLEKASNAHCSPSRPASHAASNLRVNSGCFSGLARPTRRKRNPRSSSTSGSNSNCSREVI